MSNGTELNHFEYYSMLRIYNSMDDSFWNFDQDILDAFFDRLFAFHDSEQGPQ